MAAPTGYQHELGVSEPSYCKLKHSVHFIFAAKLGRLMQVWKIFTMCQKQHEKLLSEFKFLQLMIFKRNGQLRKEKSIQLLKRVQACLKRFHVGTKLYKCMNELCQDVTSSLKEVEVRGGSCFLPARQLWVFALYVQSKYMELLGATASYCISAFEHLSCQFSTGMLIPQMLLFMGGVSRIWLLSTGIREKLAEAYKEIYAVLEYISRAPSQWVEPALPPVFINKGLKKDDAAITRHTTMFQMASHSHSQELSDAEDLGESVAVEHLQIDEKSKSRKRTRDDEKTETLFKKMKIANNKNEPSCKIKGTKRLNKIKNPKRKKLDKQRKKCADTALPMNDAKVIGKKKDSPQTISALEVVDKNQKDKRIVMPLESSETANNLNIDKIQNLFIASQEENSFSKRVSLSKRKKKMKKHTTNLIESPKKSPLGKDSNENKTICNQAQESTDDKEKHQPFSLKRKSKKKKKKLQSKNVAFSKTNQIPISKDKTKRKNFIKGKAKRKKTKNREPK